MVFLTFVVITCGVILLASKLSGNNETLGDTGWTVEQFIEWADEASVGEYVKEHKKRWKIWKDGRKELIEPNEPFKVGIINDINDVNWIYPMYKREWEIFLPPELPEPVIGILENINHQDVGKNIGEILPYAAESVAICAFQEEVGEEEIVKEIVSYEAVKIKLLSLSDNKLSFSVETEPFILSDNPDVHGRISNRMVLYVPEGCKVGICKPQKEKGGGL